MPNIISTDLFQGELEVGQRSEQSVQSALGLFIAKYEPEYLRFVMGDSLAKLYLVDPNTGVYLDITNGKDYVDSIGVTKHLPSIKNAIACYVYTKWMRNENSQTAGLGEQKPKIINAVNVTPWHKIVRSWNEMVEYDWQLFEFLNINISTYPTAQYINRYSMVYQKMNHLF